MKAVAAIASIAISLLPLGGCESQASKEASHQSQPPVAATQMKPADSTPVNSAWEKTTKTNDLDGKVSVILKKSDIIIRCTQGKRADSYWNPGNAGFVGPLGSMPDTQIFFPSDGERVRWRIDNGPLHSESWSASEDDHALFFPSRDLMEWEKGKSLVLEYREFEKTSDTVTIDISGLKESLAGSPCRLN